MSLKIDADRAVDGLIFATWNQDFSRFAVGVENGFRIYESDPLKEKSRVSFADGGIGCIEMLYKCNYIALIGGGRKPKYPSNNVCIWDDLKQDVIINIEFKSPVKAVRLRRDRIIAILESCIKIYSFTQTPQLIYSCDSASNPNGLCALCPSSLNSILAFPSPKTGCINLLNLSHESAQLSSLQAHDSAIAALEISVNGLRLATASEKGTIIRVFDTERLELVHEVRRGTNRAHIYCLAFNHSAEYLCVTSDHSTVHVFHLSAKTKSPQSRVNSEEFVENETSPGTGDALEGQSKIKRTLKSIVNPDTSFCRFELPKSRHSNTHSMVAFGQDHNSIIIVMSDGGYYKYHFKTDEKNKVVRDLSARFLELNDSTYY